MRVERLQDISEEQAKAEGVRLYTDHAELGDWWHAEGIETYRLILESLSNCSGHPSVATGTPTRGSGWSSSSG